MPDLYKNKTPHARCVLKIQDWFANNLSIITQPVRDEMAELIVKEISDDIKEPKLTKLTTKPVGEMAEHPIIKGKTILTGRRKK